MRYLRRPELKEELTERLLDLVLSSRFWAAVVVAVVVTWLVVANPVRIEPDGSVVVPGLPESIADILGLDETTLESPEPPR
jgi:hypothetical protein